MRLEQINSIRMMRIRNPRPSGPIYQAIGVSFDLAIFPRGTFSRAGRSGRGSSIVEYRLNGRVITTEKELMSNLIRMKI